MLFTYPLMKEDFGFLFFKSKLLFSVLIRFSLLPFLKQKTLNAFFFTFKAFKMLFGDIPDRLRFYRFAFIIIDIVSF